MAELKEKSIPLAIGLNILLPGVGYMYMGKLFLGIAAFLLILMMLLASPLIGGAAWFSMNVIMAIDMVILGKKREKQISEGSTMKCPRCAELIKKEAKVCRFCNAPIGT